MVSIVVPVYQAEALIKSCVGSVNAQSCKNWELILVDDGSTDGSGRICDELAAADERIKVIHQANRGVSEARNTGINAAQGEYIAFLDADDRYEPDMLSTLREKLDETGADCAGCAHYNEFSDGVRNTEGLGISAGLYEGDALREAVVKRLLRDRLEGEELFNGFIWRFVYKTDIIKRNGLRFEGIYLEDELFLIEYFCLARMLYVVDTPLYVYYQNPASVTRNYLPDFSQIFEKSYRMKTALVEKYGISGIKDWEMHTLWAGLLMAVANELAAGNRTGFWAKRKKLAGICKSELFSPAVSGLKPRNIAGNKSIVAKLVRARLYTLLTLLYALKNR